MHSSSNFENMCGIPHAILSVERNTEIHDKNTRIQCHQDSRLFSIFFFYHTDTSYVNAVCIRSRFFLSVMEPPALFYSNSSDDCYPYSACNWFHINKGVFYKFFLSSPSSETAPGPSAISIINPPVTVIAYRECSMIQILLSLMCAIDLNRNEGDYFCV